MLVVVQSVRAKDGVSDEQNENDIRSNVVIGSPSTTNEPRKREDYLVKLGQLKEKQTQKRVEVFVKDITNLQQKRTTQLKVVLGNISRTLGKMEGVISTAKIAGKDTTTAEADLGTAKVAVADAQSAIDAMAGKDFTPTITNVTTLRFNLTAERNEFATDINGISAKIRVAKAAVAKVLADVRVLR